MPSGRALPGAARTGGRVRSQAATEDVLTAAAQLLEEVGYRAVSIEAIAARSGVAKSTIYRWWPSKGALVMSAHDALVARRVREPDTGVLTDDLMSFTRQLYRVSEHPARVQALRGLMVEAQLDPEFAVLFQSWVAERRALVGRLLQRGLERGEIRADVDLDYAIDLVFGPFWYRLLVGHAPLRPADARRHVALVVKGIAVATV